MAVEVDSLCMGCMEPKVNGSCPNPATCGWPGQSAAETFPHLPPGTVLERRYVLGRTLGQGGFGITYLSGDLQAYRKLALKEYFPTSFAQRSADRRTVTHAGASNREPYQYGLDKFEEESRTLLKFQHSANIVHVDRFFRSNGTAYIVMEFLDGETLFEFLNRQPDRRISFPSALVMLTPVMEGLKEVHLAGITHRDISPDNIFICKSGEMKLLDFGAARQAFRDQTKSQQLILKPGYTPEESYRGSGSPGPWTDIYSFGAVMYRCITGKVPPEALDRMIEDTLQPPGQLTRMQADPERALLKALSVRAKDRHRSIEDLQHALGKSSQEDHAAESRKPVSFAIWFGVAAIFISAGSLIEGARWAYWLGLLPAAIAIGLALFPRPRRRLAVGTLRIAFTFLVVLGTALTYANPAGILVLVVAAFVGFSSLGARTERNSDMTARLGLRCVRGELAGNTLTVGSGAIIIGRLADRANLVISSAQISGAHTRVAREVGTGALSIEDLDSRNGTFIRRARAQPGWVRIHKREALSKGDRFYLCDEQIALFEIIET